MFWLFGVFCDSVSILRFFSEFLWILYWNSDWYGIKYEDYLWLESYIHYHPASPWAWVVFPPSRIFTLFFQCLKVLIVKTFHFFGWTNSKVILRLLLMWLFSYFFLCMFLLVYRKATNFCVNFVTCYFHEYVHQLQVFLLVAFSGFFNV